MKKIVTFILILTVVFVNAQTNPLITKDSIAQKKWTDSIMSSLTIDQKIGQLFMIAAYSNKDKKHTDYIESVIRKHEIGGLIFMQGTPEKQVKLNNKYQWLSDIPLLIAFDGEWGLDMRLKKTYRFPWNMTLGAIRDDMLIEEFGNRVGEQCKRMGIHVNFAPVVDINTNPKNPIIGNRSFGENKYNVANKSVAFTNGIQSQSVMACAKHFPGHGDTESDSHKTLPTIKFSAERIDSVELYPYKQLFKHNIGSVMAAHLSVPSLVENSKLPSSLSSTVLTDLLKNKMQFKGLIFTDALNMKGVSEYVTDDLEVSKSSSIKDNRGKIDVMAFLAGNDVLLFSENVEAAVKQIKKALKDKTLTEDRIDESVRKILNAKYWCGLDKYEDISSVNLAKDLNTKRDEILHRKLIRNAITLIKNENAIFPIRDLVKSKIAYVKIGNAKNDAFVNRLKDYTDVTVFNGENTNVITQIGNYNTIIFGVHKSNDNPWKSYQLTKLEKENLKLISEIAKTNNSKIILNIFASPYALLDFNDFNNFDVVLVSYQNSKISQDLSAQMIFGALGTKGRLPVNIGTHFSEGFGLQSTDLKRLSFGIPEEVNMSSIQLKRIDSIAKVVLKEKMAPGMQVLVARHGKVVFQKNYGFYTANKTTKVTDESIYDLASLTKILGALPQIMKAEEQGKFSVNDRLDKLFPVTKGSNKDTVTIKEALAHKGRLRPWIPFYVKTLDSLTKKPMKKYYRNAKSKKFPIRIAKNLYLRKDYMDTIYQRIADAPQRIRPGYKYSGFAFYLFKEFIERTYKKPLNILNDEDFYLPLGARRLTYKPLEKFKKKQIVPTEIDNYYRHQLLQGDVHDMGAAMLDGVSGNAGLFGNSLDIAKMMQMYLQKGYYGGKRYLKTGTLKKFNTRYYKSARNRRGLGFDKQQINKKEKATCDCVSEESFGHSGFTGTYAWADPESGIVYIFLSNRVYPNMSNRALGKEGIRTKVQRIIQEAITDKN